MNVNLNKIVNNIYNEPINEDIKNLINKGCEVYIVGGYIRDSILGKSSCDKDYVIKGESAVEFAKKLAEKIEGHFVLLDEDFDIARVVMQDKINYLDFAGCFGEDITEDLGRRDFALNAIALRIDANEAELIDPYSGIDDIKNKTIKAISEKNIQEDPLRCFRAYRFSAQLGFAIEENTSHFIVKHYPLMEKVATERINVEITKMFEGYFCSKNLEMMKENGLLFEVLPEIECFKKVPPNLHHHLNLIDHSIETVRQIELIFDTLPEWLQEHLNSDQAQGIKYISLLKIAALVHDLGKPTTWQIDEEGRHRFIGHEEEGASLSIPLFKRLKFSKNAIKYMSKLIKYHLYPSQLIRPHEPTTEKAMMRMFRRLESETPDVIVLAMADRFATRGVEITEEIVKNNIEGLFYFLEKYIEAKEKVDSLPKLIDGNEIMALGIPKGPEIGRILNALKEVQISGDVNTKEEALAFVKGFEWQKN